MRRRWGLFYDGAERETRGYRVNATPSFSFSTHHGFPPFPTFLPPFLSIRTYANVNTPSASVGSRWWRVSTVPYVPIYIQFIRVHIRIRVYVCVCGRQVFEWGLNIVHEYFASPYLKERETRTVRYNARTTLNSFVRAGWDRLRKIDDKMSWINCSGNRKG